MELAAREYGLSKREEEITVLVLQGENNAVIGDRLAITDSTLRTHLRDIYGKTAVHSRQELIALLQAYLRRLGRAPRRGAAHPFSGQSSKCSFATSSPWMMSML